MVLKRLVLAAFSAVLLSSGFASAATCSNLDVSGATDCAMGSTNNDKINPLQVNVDDIFGPEDWTFISKEENGDLDGEYQTSGLYSTFMLVLKGANGPNGYNYHAYLLGDSSGTYSMNPFAFDGKGTSHATLYGRSGETTVVPLPAAGFMLLAGLGGFAMVRRKR